MKSRFFIRAVGALALLLPPVIVLAQNGAAPTVAAPSATTPGNVVIRNSPQGTAVYDDARGIARLTKDVTVVQTGEDFILYAQTLTYNRLKNQAIAEGNLRVETRDSTIKGGKMYADFNTKTITLIGSVVISAHGKGDGIVNGRSGFRSELQHKPVRIACDRLDWDYDIRQATLTGNIRMVQEDNVGTCDRIIYDEGRNIAQLQGNVRFGDAKNRNFVGNDLLIYIDDGRVQTDSRVTIRIPANDSPTAAQSTPARKAPKNFAPPRQINDNDLEAFNLTPPPIPTPRPEATEEPTGAPEAATPPAQ